MQNDTLHLTYLRGLAATVSSLALLSFATSTPHQPDVLPASSRPASGEALYEQACASCHGSDGRGAPQIRVGFSTPLPDFSDCNFASREPRTDWLAIAHEGGPVRGFDRMMPAFGDALTEDELHEILDYIDTFCRSGAWPSGDLNLPRALITEKAFPEDEAVLTSSIDTEGPGNVANKFVYEKRFGARSQVELIVPFAFANQTGADGTEGWSSGLGDVAVGVKYAFYHNVKSGTIASLAGEVIFPTGKEMNGFGRGTTVFEPFGSVGQLLPFDTFIQAQAGLELPANTDLAENEGFWRLVAGKSLSSGRWGRTWSPMIELLGARALEETATTSWDLVPQIQITLNRRQHIMANVGVRVPLSDSGSRSTQIVVYLLWDWFDGGLFDGW
jgi:mono/diheme cytochrome c family protein